MERAVAIRKRILSLYNMTREDFENLNDYNDYLEQVEDIIFQLEQRINVDAIEAQVARYKAENGEAIAMRAARAAERQGNLLREQQLQQQRGATVGATDGNAAMAGQGAGMQKMDVAVPHSEAPSSVMSYIPSATATAPHHTHGATQVPQPLEQRPAGPAAPDEAELGPEALQLKHETAVRAGGFTVEMTRARDLEEAFCSVFVH